MNFPPDRHGDNRWNLCLDRLIEAWNRAGPDVTLAVITMAAESVITPEGVVRVNVGAARDALEGAAIEKTG